MKKRLNNKGFTLVEVIIAVALLVIALTPVAANFIQSSKMNLKSRKNMNAMNLAQDIMEGMSGYTADKVIGQFDEVVNDNTKNLAGKILPVSASYDTGAGIGKSTSSDGKITYTISNVETVGTAQNKYNVQVMFDPTNQDEYNEIELANIAEINQNFDAVYTHVSSETNSAITALRQKSDDLTIQSPAYVGNIKRTIQVLVKNAGTVAAPNYQVEVKRIYSVISPDSFAIDAADNSYEQTTANISRMDGSNLPKNIYIYFEGIEGASYSQAVRRDNFEVINSSGKEVSVYLIRTQNADNNGNVTTAVQQYGENYGCEVNVDTTNSVNDVQLITNLRYDLNAVNMRYNFRVNKEDGSPIPDADIDFPKTDSVDGRATLDRTQTKYNSARAIYKYKGTKITEAQYQSNFNDGYSVKKKNTLYKVQILIKNPSTNEVVATYDGGLSN